MIRRSDTRTRRRVRGARRAYAIATACVALLAGMLVLGATAQRGLPGERHYVVVAEFADAANLGRYAEVRIAGRRVGQVLDLEHHAGAARARLQLDREVAPLRQGTTARIRLKGLLGAKFVELRPATDGAALPDGAVIPRRSTSTTVELFDLLETLDSRRRAALRATIQGLGAGFLGRGDELGDGLRDFPAGLRALTEVAEEINARAGAAQRLFPSVDGAAHVFDSVRRDLAAGFDPAARALAPFAERRAEVTHALDRAPGALRAAEDGLRRTDPLLRETARLARSAIALTEPAPRVLTQATHLLRESSRPLRTTRAVLRQAAQAVPDVLALTRTVDPLVAPARRLLSRGLPLLRELDRYGCDVLGFARNWRSMLAFGIPGEHPIGPINGLRVQPVVSDEAAADLPRLRPDPVGYPQPCQLGPVPPLEATR